MRCGQGKAREEAFGCGKSKAEQCWWPANRTGAALLGCDPVQLLAVEACSDLVAALHRADVQAHPGTSRDASCLSSPPGRAEVSLRASTRDQNQRTPRQPGSLAGKTISCIIEHLWFTAARG